MEVSVYHMVVLWLITGFLICLPPFVVSIGPPGGRVGRKMSPFCTP